MLRYLRLLGIQLRASTLLMVQYRADFVLGTVMSLFWIAAAVVPVVVVYDHRSMVAGWSFPEALLVFAFYLALKAVLDGAIHPSLVSVGEQIRKGTLDFLLLKPADAQFLASTARFEPRHVIDLAAAGALLGVAFARLGRTPSAGEVALAVALLGAALTVLYSLWILVIAAAFWVVRVDNLSYLFNAIFDVARWPATIFRGALRLIFTFVLPVALMTTYPAEALLGRLRPEVAAASLGGAAAFAWVARRVWQKAIGHYTSASS